MPHVQTDLPSGCQNPTLRLEDHYKINDDIYIACSYTITNTDVKYVPMSGQVGFFVHLLSPFLEVLAAIEGKLVFLQTGLFLRSFDEGML